MSWPPKPSVDTSVDMANTSVRSTNARGVRTRARHLGTRAETLCFLLLLLSLSACGYRTAGHSDLLPHNIKTIAIPAFDNVTTRYQLSDEIPESIARELITRTRYTVVSDPKQADAVVRGTITRVITSPVVFDQTTGRATGVEIQVLMQVRLIDRAGKALYARDNYNFREQYEISVNPRLYFDESPAALRRLSLDAAKDIVSSILENF